MCKEHNPEHRSAFSPPVMDSVAEDLTLENFQVVRREFFSCVREPAITFYQCRFYVNTVCLTNFPDTDCVQILVNPVSRILALRPCGKTERDAFKWCVLSGGRRRPRQAVCSLFFAKITALMSWSADYRYRISGRLAYAEGESLLVFDLSAAEAYRSTAEGTGKARQVPLLPADWRDQFGLPAAEHARAVEIPVLDGYTVYAVQDGTDPPEHEEENPA